MGQSAGTALVFSTPSATYGLIQSYNVEDNTKRAEAMGPGGNVNAIQEYDNQAKLTLSYLRLASPTGTPKVGTSFSFRGRTWYIDTITSGYTVDGFMTMDVAATQYPNLP